MAGEAKDTRDLRAQRKGFALGFNAALRMFSSVAEGTAVSYQLVLVTLKASQREPPIDALPVRCISTAAAQRCVAPPLLSCAGR